MGEEKKNRKQVKRLQKEVKRSLKNQAIYEEFKKKPGYDKLPKEAKDNLDSLFA